MSIFGKCYIRSFGSYFQTNIRRFGGFHLPRYFPNAWATFSSLKLGNILINKKCYTRIQLGHCLWGMELRVIKSVAECTYNIAGMCSEELREIIQFITFFVVKCTQFWKYEYSIQYSHFGYNERIFEASKFVDTSNHNSAACRSWVATVIYHSHALCPVGSHL